MKFNKALMSSAVVVAAFTGTQAFAAGPTLTDVLGASGITTSGTFDFSYDWSKNDEVFGTPGNGGDAPFLRAFDTENDGFSFHQANLTASKAFDGGIGATINVLMGDDAEVTGGDGDEFDLTQAYLSKSMGNLTVIGGKFVTLAGMEVINSAGNINASRSLLFANQPLVHEGVRASYKVSDLLSVSLGLNNAQFATSTTDENNTDLTLEAQLALTPAKNLSAFLTYYSGNEDIGDDNGDGVSDGDADVRSDTVDLVVNFNLTDAIYLGLNADYFRNEEDGGGSNEATGVAGYAQVKFLPKWRAALRSEYLNLDAGAGQGDAYLRENTLTLAHACTDNLEILVEGRHDRSGGQGGDFKAFANINGMGGEGGFPGDEDQYTGTIKAILKF